MFRTEICPNFLRLALVLPNWDFSFCEHVQATSESTTLETWFHVERKLRWHEWMAPCRTCRQTGSTVISIGVARRVGSDRRLDFGAEQLCMSGCAQQHLVVSTQWKSCEHQIVLRVYIVFLYLAFIPSLSHPGTHLIRGTNALDDVFGDSCMPPHYLVPPVTLRTKAGTICGHITSRCARTAYYHRTYGKVQAVVVTSVERQHIRHWVNEHTCTHSKVRSAK